MQNFNVGVIGCGVLGTRHAEIYNRIPDVNLVGVYDTQLDKAKSLANDLGVIAFDTLESLQKEINAASVCTPAIHHHKVAAPLLKAGIHLLIEKPITTTLEDADDLIEIAQTQNLVLQTGHIERFNGAVSAVKKIVKKPIYIECDRIGFYDPRISDVGVILDLMIHDIDILLYFANSPVKEIHAMGMNIISDSEDFANARILFESGAVGNLTASRMAQKRLRKIRIFEKHRYTSLDYYRQEAQTFTKESAQISESIYMPVDIRKTNPLEEEINAFTHAIHNKIKPQVDGRDGRAALAVALQILDQIRSKSGSLV